MIYSYIYSKAIDMMIKMLIVKFNNMDVELVQENIQIKDLQLQWLTQTLMNSLTNLTVNIPEAIFYGKQ